MKLRERGFPGQTTQEVTEREILHRQLSRRAAAEGFVLLKNEDRLLPLQKGSKIGLYGAGAVKTIKGGTGSGDVNERDCVNIYQGMVNAGYEVTSRAWLEDYAEIYMQARLEWKDEIYKKLPKYNGNFFEAYSSTQFQMPCGSSIDEKAAGADGADTAVFVLSRVTGENADRHDTEGDYYITSEEKALLHQVAACYKNVILVINTGGLIDLAFTEEFSNIKAIIQFMQAGQEGGNAFADMLSGAVTPSGKLTDTWALNYKDYPNAAYFSSQSGDVYKEEYREGIYVGYRYFDTFDVPVRYCFGYGLSYTEFELSAGEISVKGMGTKKPMAAVRVNIRNIGDTYAGKEVVQIYVSCPQAGMEKEFRRLAGFGKSSLLAPGEAESMEISFSLSQLASYCEERSAWILEAGSYGIWVGNSLNSAVLEGAFELDETAVLTQCGHICERKEALEELHADRDRLCRKEEIWKAQAREKALPVVRLKASEILTETISYAGLSDRLPGKAGEITESLSIDQLVALATGDLVKGQGSELGSAGQTVPGAAAETAAAARMDPWKVASIVLADGPAGLRLSKAYQVINKEIVKGDFLDALEGGFFAPEKEKRGETYYQYCTAIPVGTLLAQTWNTELIEEVGEMIGHEMELFGVTLWLAPGMNIHRNPLCGRNFEYYSEDPLLSGIMASAMTLGVQRVPGCGTTIKHFACNNQEDNRMGSDSVLSERTLREIYLKGFEIAVKNAQPMSIMTSYNLINGVHAANCYDICTKAARDEWGFAGAIMTDWTTTTNSTAGTCTAAGCMRAGNDMVMPGDLRDHDCIRRELEAGTLDIRELKRCVCNTVRVILQSNQYEGARSYLELFEDLGVYMTADKSGAVK
ncbi:MAG: glycoside hydrolase family 3 C-terminal domain-containing protein [Eubacteriales bacterium]|nr:glycoside hydrolase family 3 C-terminal domain-containing protein [Eubacteriales bacterium]